MQLDHLDVTKQDYLINSIQYEVLFYPFLRELKYGVGETKMHVTFESHKINAISTTHLDRLAFHYSFI